MDFGDRLKNALKDAANQTDAEISGEISKLTRLREDEIREICPKAEDSKKLLELLNIVKSAENENTKISRIVQNSEKFAGIVVRLLGKIV